MARIALLQSFHPLLLLLGCVVSSSGFSAGGDVAYAQPSQSAIAHCRATAGRASVMACMGGGGDAATCRTQAIPAVRKCVRSAMMRSGGGMAGGRAGRFPGGSQGRDCAALSLERGFNQGIKDRQARHEFMMACQQGRQN